MSERSLRNSKLSTRPDPLPQSLVTARRGSSLTSPKPLRLTDFAEAVRTLRYNHRINDTRSPMSRRAVAMRVQCRESDVIAWEDGTSYPTEEQFIRLRDNVDQAFQYFRPFLQEHWEAKRDAALQHRSDASNTYPSPSRQMKTPLNSMKQDLEAAIAEPPLHSSTEGGASTPSSSNPPAFTFFGQALQKVRDADGLTEREAADMMGVQKVQWRYWEKGDYLPAMATYKKLLELWPELEAAPALSRTGRALGQPACPVPVKKTTASDYFGRALYTIRVDNNLSMQEAAERVGKRTYNWSKWEAGDMMPLAMTYRKLIAEWPELQAAPAVDRFGRGPLEARPGGRRKKTGFERPLQQETAPLPQRDNSPSDGLAAAGLRYGEALARVAEAESAHAAAKAVVSGAQLAATEIRKAAEREAARLVAEADKSIQGTAEAVTAAKIQADRVYQELQQAATAVVQGPGK